jgi:subtilisin family serine protease
MLYSNHNTFFTPLAALVLCLTLLGANAATAQVARPEFVPGELLIKVTEGTPQRRVLSMLAGVNGLIIRRHRLIAAPHVRVPRSDVIAAVSYLRSLADVIVAVIDSGIALSHPDLNIWTNPGEIPGNVIDDDGNGFVDDVRRWDFAGNDNNPTDPAPVFASHGTHTGGTIGAIGNNGIGITGVNWDVTIMPLRVYKRRSFLFFDVCSATDSDIIDAILYAARLNTSRAGTSFEVSGRKQETALRCRFQLPCPTGISRRSAVERWRTAGLAVGNFGLEWPS